MLHRTPDHLNELVDALLPYQAAACEGTSCFGYFRGKHLILYDRQVCSHTVRVDEVHGYSVLTSRSQSTVQLAE